MGELLKEISLNHEIIDSFTAEQVEQAKTELAEFRGIADQADAEMIDEALAIAARLSARSDTLEAESVERDAKLAELEKALGITDAEVEEIVAQEEGPEDEEDDESEDEEAKALEPVVASANMGNVAKLVPADRRPQKSEPEHSLVASAGPNEGTILASMHDVGALIADRARKTQGVGQWPIASLEGVKHKYELTSSDEEQNRSIFAQIARDARENGNLTASGGFCAPAEVTYDFFDIATDAGILNFPTASASRGSVVVPISPSLGDFIGENGIAREWTNANDENPTSPATKPVFVFECPDTQTCEVSAWPTIIQFGNFVARFYPEAVANATRLALIAARRALNVGRIAFLNSVDTAGEVLNTTGGTLVQLTHNLGSNAADYRATYGMGTDAVLDVVLPHWLRDAAYADAITRGSTNGAALNAWLGAIFAELNLRPQFVYDLDPQTDGRFELEANVFMYAPGTVVELDAGTLDLGVVRDSELNSTNDYQIFVEPFVGWCMPGHEVRSLLIPVCADGGVGEAVNIACPPAS